MDRGVDVGTKKHVVLAAGKKDQSGTGASAKDGESGVGEQHSQGGVAPAVDGIHTSAFDDGLDQFCGGELFGRRFVRIRWIDDREIIIMVHSIGSAEGRRFILGILIRVRRIRKMLGAPLQR